MGNPLNYDATMPISAAPFVVQVDPKSPPGDRFKDYIPNPNVSSVVVPVDVKKKERNFMRPPVSRYTEDYISPADSAIKLKNERAEITLIAQQFYEAENGKRIAYKNAKKLIEASGDKDTPEVQRAKKIISHGAPITKEQALEKAAKQFYGLRK